MIVRLRRVVRLEPLALPAVGAGVEAAPVVTLERAPLVLTELATNTLKHGRLPMSTTQARPSLSLVDDRPALRGRQDRTWSVGNLPPT